MSLLLRIQLLKLKNAILRSSAGDRVKTAAFATLGLLFFSALHWGFIRFLTEIRNVELIGPLLLVKILAMAFLTTFLMIVFSSTITAFSTLFFARDLSMLVHTPLPYRTLFAFKSLETALFSSWMVVIALIPFLAAYGRVNGQGPGFYLLLGLLGIPFVGSASVLGTGLSLLLMRAFPARRVREIMLILAIVICTGLFLWVRWLAPARFLRADTMEVLIQYISLIEAPTAPYLPSWWLAQAVGGYAAGNFLETAQYGVILAASFLLLGALLLFAGERAYYGGWSAAQEFGGRRRTRPLGPEWRMIPPIFGGRFRAILGKDLLVFFRDSNQWSQLLMLASIVAVYLISIRKLPLDTPYLRGLVSFLNIGMVGFVLASVALRFVFPAVSLEGRAWWALRAAPMGLGGILWGKWLGGVVPIAGMAVLLVWASNHFLAVDPFVGRLSTFTAFLMAVTLCGMGVGFGALFPRFGVENVAQIQTSAGGMLFMVTALFYVGATLALEAIPLRAHYFHALGRSPGRSLFLIVYPIAALAVLNLAAFAVPFALGKWSLERADI